MKKFLLIAAVLLSCAGVVRADEPAIVNEPANAWENFRKVLETAEPSGDALFDISNGEFRVGSSIRLYTFERVHVPVVNDLDLRLGWMETQGLYGTLSLALDRVTGKEVLKHVHVGWYGGRQFNEEDWMTGVVGGAKF